MAVVNYKTIIALFLNGLFAIGVILLVIGFVSGVQLTAKLFVFDQYPLETYEEDCGRYGPSYPMIEEKTGSPSAQPNQLSDQECKKRLDHRRKIKLVNDTSHTIGFLVAGFVMSLLFNPRSRFVANLI